MRDLALSHNSATILELRGNGDRVIGDKYWENVRLWRKAGMTRC